MPAIKRARRHSDTILVQEFVVGVPIGVEAVFWDGECVATYIMDDSLTGAFPSPVGHGYPSQMGARDEARIRKIIADCGAAIGLTSGGLNADLRLTEKGPVIIEINPRPGGAAIAELLREAADIDVNGAAVAVALNESPLPFLKANHKTPVASRMFVSRSRPQWVPSPDAMAELGRQPGISLLEATMTADGIPPTVDEWYILGRCLTTAATLSEAQRRAELAEMAFFELLGIDRDNK